MCIHMVTSCVQWPTVVRPLNLWVWMCCAIRHLCNHKSFSSVLLVRLDASCTRRTLVSCVRLVCMLVSCVRNTCGVVSVLRPLASWVCLICASKWLPLASTRHCRAAILLVASCGTTCVLRSGICASGCVMRTLESCVVCTTCVYAYIMFSQHMCLCQRISSACILRLL